MAINLKSLFNHFVAELKPILDDKGNANVKIKQNLTIQPSSWTAISSGYLSAADYQVVKDAGGAYMADVTISGIDATWFADVLPDTVGNQVLVDYNCTFANKLRLYAKEKPTTAIRLISVEIIKEVIKC